MGVKKPTTLRIAFWRFLFMLLASLLVSVIIPFAALTLAVTSGIATYADFSEIRANEIAPIIAATPDLSDIELPMGIKYALLDKNYQLLDCTLENDELEQAMHYATTGKSEENLTKQYLLITRENEYVVLQYPVGSQFTIEWMNEHLPAPDMLLIIIIGINCIMVCIFLTARFAKNMRLQLAPLFDATSEVAKQNLDFEVGHSKFKEFEDVLLSFSNMKDSLKTSLEQQWKAEQMQREQIAALAHDLKTPLTIIQGNADLINETELDGEQRLYAGYITTSSEQMQLYIKTLIDISRAAAGYQFHKEDIDPSCYLEQIRTQIEALCRTKEITLKMTVRDLPDSMTADKLLLERAIMNVINNALDYSPLGGTIYIAVTGNMGVLQISVIDEGEGFSREALLHAHEKFYMADCSRGIGLHFGMGLYAANLIINQHGGQLILENSTETGGARVTVKIPC